MLIVNSEVNACSCDTISFKEASEHYADEIFVGKIIKAERYEIGRYKHEEGDEEEIDYGWKYLFEVEKKWKGSSDKLITIYHHGSTCDTYFDIYAYRYLVYASRDRGKEKAVGVTSFGKPKKLLSTWLCARNIDAFQGWFSSDTTKLNQIFPNSVQLKTPNPYLKWIWSLILILILLDFGQTNFM